MSGLLIGKIAFPPSSPWRYFKTAPRRGRGLVLTEGCAERTETHRSLIHFGRRVAVFGTGKAEGRQGRQAEGSGGLIPGSLVGFGSRN